MNHDIQQLATLTKEWQYYDNISGALYWDMEVMMPKKGAENRSKLLGFLSVKRHEAIVNPEIGTLLQKLKSQTLSETEQALVREVSHVYERATKVPASLMQQMTELESKATVAWRDARAKNDFAAFTPYLTQIIALKRAYAHAIDPNKDPYEVLVQDFEQDLTVEKIEQEFSILKEALVPLIRKIADAKKPRMTSLEKDVPTPIQQELNKELVLLLGLDLEYSRLDVSTHPMSFWFGDSRITTRYSNIVWGAMRNTAHETGHALYELGIPRDLPGNLGQANSLVVHESQSRLWENHVVHSKAFLSFFLPKLNEKYGTSYTVDEFYATINEVKPSFIRVEADEVTYPMHVILRFEIEKRLIRGDLLVDELPRVWNEKMQELLGICPSDDKQGCLQDVHWSQGGFGYFPTYVLGSMYAAQFWKAMQQRIPHLEQRITIGDTTPILEWLREHVHKHGSIYTSSGLMRKATGKEFNAKDYVDYLTEKYSAIYKQ